MHVSIPEVPSEPWKVTVTAWLNQPFASAARAVAVAVGRVVSYFTGCDAEDVLPAWSRQVPATVVPVVSGPA